ncbi:MAG TPA: hypothetical protein VEI96_08445 [Thermodesulfovibrionales bacterium]|nr:hypothetical protein [Thermodesulfovibrionales bacterium]
MLPDAYISHQTPERLRIKIPSRKRDQAYLTRMKELLSALEGIEAVECNPLTGSLLLTHKVVKKERIAEYAAVNSLFRINGLNASPVGLQRRISGTFKGMDSQLKTFTGGEIDIGGLAFLVLLGAGIYQMSMGNVTALPWYGAFWYAFNIFLKSNSAPA